MKKSEKIKFAMLAVVDSTLDASVKLEVLETLMAEKGLAEYMERVET